MIRYLFVGGAFDGEHYAVGTDSNGRPFPSWDVPIIPRVKARLAPVTSTAMGIEKMQVQRYIRKSFRGADGYDRFVYTTSQRDLVDLLIEGYSKSRTQHGA